MAIKRINRSHSLHELYYVVFELENYCIDIIKEVDVVTKLDKSGQVILDIAMPTQRMADRKAIKTGFFGLFPVE